MTGKMPPVPPANQTTKGPKLGRDDEHESPLKETHTQNTEEQGDTANIRQNTTNKGYFQGRRVK